MGKAKTKQYQTYLNEAEKIYNNLDAEYDLMFLELHKHDVNIYYTSTGFVKIINILKRKFDRIADPYKHEYAFRIGILYGWT